MESVNVNIYPETFDDELLWKLDFVFNFHNDFTYKYEIQEPYLISKQEWIDFSHNKLANLCIYNGNSEGYIQCNDNKWSFVANCSGAGGDVYTTFTASYDLFKLQLINAINEAINNDYKFSYGN